jgi:hypothetical protein
VRSIYWAAGAVREVTVVTFAIDKCFWWTWCAFLDFVVGVDGRRRIVNVCQERTEFGGQFL